MEKVYKTMRSAGFCNIIIGVVVLVMGVTVGILAIINGGALLKGKSEITF